MQVTGRVIRIDNDMVSVAVERATACGESCANCSGNCKMSKNIINVKNDIGARVGEFVVIETDSKSVLLSAFLVYILPVIMLCIGYILGETIGFGEEMSIFCGFVVFVITFIFLHFYDKKSKQRLNTKIVEIIK